MRKTTDKPFCHNSPHSFKNRTLGLNYPSQGGIVFVLQNEFYYVACLPMYGDKNNRPFIIIAEKDNRVVFKGEILYYPK